jgi:hypothetical protein
VLTWTEAGAVQRPDVVQIRVQRAYPGRVRAGAPVPTRSMSRQEIEANLRFFTEGMSGPRARRCLRLVLSGVGVAAREDTPELLARARALGMERIVLHIGAEDLERFELARHRDQVDVVVVPVQPGPGVGLGAGARVLRACVDAGVDVAANTVLSEAGLRDLEVAARTIASAGPRSATFTYPFPIAGNTAAMVPPVGAVVAALSRAVPRLEEAGVQVNIKGLPRCYLGSLGRLVGRTINRWYVDADHQLGEAILFFPGVVRFHKSEACRFCLADADCDGFFATYLRRSGFPDLEPISEP